MHSIRAPVCLQPFAFITLLTFVPFFLATRSATLADSANPQQPQRNSISSYAVTKTEKLMKVESDLKQVSAYADSVRAQYEADLKSFVDIPSVSADPSLKGDIEKMAKLAVARLKALGATAEILSSQGYPIVFGEFTAGKNYPTVTVYNHLDVQPADSNEWKTPPFSMAVDGDIYRGRGTTDDKGPALTVLYAAKYAHEHKLPINIKFIWELEEESGSPSFQACIEKNREKLETDSVVVSDTIWVSRDRPAIPYGLRGLQGVYLKLKTGAKDVHSGTTGGLARNPIGELCQVISACYDAKTGHVNIPGFYDDVAKPTPYEIEHFQSSGFSLEDFKKAHELISLRTNDAQDASQRIWAQPTFEVHGITGGYTGPGLKTIVPHEGEAKISMRIVPKQDPDKIFKALQAFIQKLNPDVEVVKAGTLQPYLGEFSGPYNQAASQAMKVAFGKDAAFTREGGSIGAVVSMHEVFKTPIVFLGLSLPEHGYHAINENFDWGQARGGIVMFVEYFKELSALK
jgi:acetylornithine deacetylase/succinyl-diaminopimelate desuccinylase-like protein